MSEPIIGNFKKTEVKSLKTFAIIPNEGKDIELKATASIANSLADMGVAVVMEEKFAAQRGEGVRRRFCRFVRGRFAGFCCSWRFTPCLLVVSLYLVVENAYFTALNSLRITSKSSGITVFSAILFTRLVSHFWHI